MKTINQVTIGGNVGQDPQVRELSGNKVANFSVATSTGGYTTKDGKEIPEQTQWHSVTAWRGTAEFIEKYVHKGDKVVVLGSINYHEYEKDGQTVRRTDILANDIFLAGGNSRAQKVNNDTPVKKDIADDLPF